MRSPRHTPGEMAALDLQPTAESTLRRLLFPALSDSQQSVSAAAFVGAKLGPYRIENRLGSGGMGVVFLAEDEVLRRKVALKVLAPNQATDPAAVQRFRNEASAAASVDHPSIARVFGYGEDAGLHFIAFEYLAAVNLRDLIRQKGRLEVGETIHYTLQLAHALAHLAAAGIVHRDIKPSNILILPTGQAKLIDLGLARQNYEDDASELTVAGTTLGTFDYISPEQAKDPRSVDLRSDIYSLGCTVYHMLTGEPPYPEGTVLQKLLDHQGKDTPDIAQKNRKVSPALSALIRRMMDSDLRKRYSHPEDVIRDLLVVAQGLGLKAPLLSGTSPPNEASRLSVFWQQNGIWLAAAMALFVLVLLVDRYPQLGQNVAQRTGSADSVSVARAGNVGNTRSGEKVAVRPGNTSPNGTDSASQATPANGPLVIGNLNELNQSGAGTSVGEPMLNPGAMLQDVAPTLAAAGPRLDAATARENTKLFGTSPGSDGTTDVTPPGIVRRPLGTGAEPGARAPEVTTTIAGGALVASGLAGTASNGTGSTGIRASVPGPGGSTKGDLRSSAVEAGDSPALSPEEMTVPPNIVPKTRTVPGDLLAGPTVPNAVGTAGLSANGANPSGTAPAAAPAAVSVVQGKAFETLEAACAGAPEGAVIELRYQGLALPAERPIRIANKRLTIRAAKGFRPAILFEPFDGSQNGMITLTGGTLALINVDLVMRVPETSTPDGYSVFLLERAEKLALQGTTVTVINRTRLPAAVVQIAPAPGQSLSMMGVKSGTANAAVEMSVANSLWRGIADGFISRDIQPVRIVLDDNYLALSGTLLQSIGQIDMPGTPTYSELSLDHCTLHLGGALMHVRGGDEQGDRLQPWSAKAQNNVIVCGKGRSLVEMRGQLEISDFRQLLTWNGDRNFFDQVTSFWSMTGRSGTPVAPPMSFEDWKRFWLTRDVSGSQNLPIRWVNFWNGKLPQWETVGAELAELDMAEDYNPPLGNAKDGTNAGVRVTALPSPPKVP